MSARKKTTISTSNVLPPSPTANIAEVIIPKENNKIAHLEVLRGKITQDADELIDSLIFEVRRIDLYRQKIEEDEMTHMRKRGQQEEEQNFILQFAQKRKQAEFEEKLTQEQKLFEENKRRDEELLKIREEHLSQKEKEHQEAKQEIAAFSQKIDKTIEEARKELAMELKKDFENEKKFVSQKYESELKLLQQQIKQLQQTIQQQEKDIQVLREEKSKVTTQINDLAVAVVRGKEASQGPTN